MSESVLSVRVRDNTAQGTRSASQNVERMKQRFIAAARATDDLDREVDRLADSLRRSARAVDQPRDALGRFQRQAERADTAVSRLSRRLGGFGGIIAGLGIGLAARQVIEYADAWTNARNRIALFTTTAQETAAVQQQLFDLAQGTRQGLGGTVELYQRLAQANERLGLAQSELLNVTRTINRAIVISGVSAESANAAIIQLSQGLSAGALRGEELNSVLEQAPRLASALATGLGVGIGQLRELGAAGELTAERVIGALQSQAGIIEGEFGRLNSTIGQSFTVLGNSLTRAVGQFSDATGAADTLAAAIRAIAEAIDNIGQVEPIIVSGPDAPAGFATGAAGRRARRQQQQVFGGPVQPFGLPIGPAPAGLNAVQRRQFFRGQLGRQPSGFAAAIGAGFDDSFQVPQQAGAFQLPALREADAILANSLREFDQFFDRLFAAQARQAPALGVGGGLQGVGAVGALPAGAFQAQRPQPSLAQQFVAADLREAAQAAADLRRDLLDLSSGFAQVAQQAGGAFGELTGVLIPLVQGGLAAGPVGILSAGLGALASIMSRTSEAALEAAAAQEQYLQALSGREATSLNAVVRARGLLDPEGLAAAQNQIFNPLADFVQDISAASDFGPSGRFTQFFNALGSLDLFRAGDINEAQLGSFGSRIGQITEGFEQAFGDISFVELGDRLIQTSDAFEELRAAARATAESFETERTNRLRFDAQEIRIRTEFARRFQGAGGDLFSQRAAFRDFEAQRRALGLAEQQAAAQLERSRSGLGGLGGAGRGFGIDTEPIEEFNRHIEVANRQLDIGQGGLNKHLETANRHFQMLNQLHLPASLLLLDGFNVRLRETEGPLFGLAVTLPLITSGLTGLGLSTTQADRNFVSLSSTLPPVTSALSGLGLAASGLGGALGAFLDELAGFELPMFGEGGRPGGVGIGDDGGGGPFDQDLTPNIPNISPRDLTPDDLFNLPNTEDFTAFFSGVGTAAQGGLLRGLDGFSIAKRNLMPDEFYGIPTTEGFSTLFEGIGTAAQGGLLRGLAGFRFDRRDLMPDEFYGTPTTEAWEEYLAAPIRDIPTILIDRFQDLVQIEEADIVPDHLMTLPTAMAWESYLAGPVQVLPTTLIDRFQEAVTITPLSVSAAQLVAVPSPLGFSQHLSAITTRANQALSRAVNNISIPSRTIALSSIVNIVDDIDTTALADQVVEAQSDRLLPNN